MSSSSPSADERSHHLLAPRACLNYARQNDKNAGFTIIELLIVIALVLVVSTISIIAGQSISRTIHLRESAVSYSNLLQEGRIRAVRDDQFYSVNISAATSSTPATAFVDIAGSGAYASGDPMMVFPSDVVPMPFDSGPALNNLKSKFLPPGPTAQNSVNTVAPGPTFGPRGLPCTPISGGGYTTCPFLAPTSFITFLQNSRNQEWEAITVTPAGRLNLWTYNSNGDWSALN